MSNYLLIILALLPIHMTLSQTFEIKSIPTSIASEMYEKGTIADDAPVGLDRLSMVEIMYYDFDGNEKSGQLIVMDAVAASVAEIFRELHLRRFPLDKVRLITAYNGSDDASMEDNNTSAHNFRKVARTTRLSLHSYGTAIDINPVQNPYILFEEGSNQVTFLPPNSVSYANRMIKRLGKSDQIGFAEEVVEVFARHGFYWWGGFWDTPIDYQHFQLDRDISYVLAAMSALEAKAFFNLLKNYYNEFQSPLENLLKEKAQKDLIELYQSNPSQFLQWVNSIY